MVYPASSSAFRISEMCSALRVSITSLRKHTFPNSQSNFIFASHKSVPAGKIFEALKKEQIYVRYFKTPGLDNSLRISIGTDEEMDTLFRFLEAYLPNA